MNKEDFYVLLDSGHGSDTPGKCSPEFSEEWKSRYGIDKLEEWAMNRNIVLGVREALEVAGFNVVHINPEGQDIKLGERVRRANKYCAKYGAGNCVFVSVHLDASKEKGWTNASGYTGYVCTKASLKSVKLANIFERNATALDMLGNRWKHTYAKDYFVLKKTDCPAILTESGFMTNKEQVEWMLSKDGYDTIVKLHCKSINDYLEKILN